MENVVIRTTKSIRQVKLNVKEVEGRWDKKERIRKRRGGEEDKRT